MSRDKRARIALETDEIVARGFYRAPSGALVELSREIETAIANTHLVSDKEVRRLAGSAGPRRLSCTLTNRTTLGAISHAASLDQSVAALVFASARSPGGGYRTGSEAQEESLARSSALVVTQKAHKAFYDQNKSNTSLLYSDAMIVSPRVPVFRNEYGLLLEAPHVATFITGAAPNAGEIRTKRERDQIETTLRRRMRAVVALAEKAGVKKLILGAWGCGVFQNRPEVVARLWSETLSESNGDSLSEGVELAVHDPDRTSETWQAFETVFGYGGYA